MINIDARSSKPIYEQIVDGMKENIIKGIIKPGDRLPSVREMAVSISANPNTVSRAYMELERQKVIESIRGKGTFVATDYTPKIVEDRLIKIKTSIKSIVVEAHYLGIDKQSLLEIAEGIYNEVQRGEDIDRNQ